MSKMNIKIDYDLNPGELCPKKISGKNGKIIDSEKVVANMSETLAIPMRMSVMEAIAEDITDTMIEEEDKSLEEAETIVDDVVDKAVELHLVSSAVKSRITKMFANKRKRQHNLNKLMMRTADYMVNRFVRMEEITEDIVVDDVLDTKEADIGVNVNDDTPIEYSGDSENNEGTTPTRMSRFMNLPLRTFDKHGNPINGAAMRRMEDDLIGEKELDTKPADDGYNVENDETIEYSGDSENNTGSVPIHEELKRRMEDNVVVNDVKDDIIVEEVVDMDPVSDKEVPYVGDVTLEPSGDSENDDGTVPTREMAAAMRSLARANVKSNNARIALIRLCAGRMTRHMLHDLRYVLPDFYKKKYGIKG